MKLYDDKMIVEIEMNTWDGHSYSEEWSRDFFDDLTAAEYNEDLDAYKVDDVEYCIEQAENEQFDDDCGLEVVTSVEYLDFPGKEDN